LESKHIFAACYDINNYVITGEELQKKHYKDMAIVFGKSGGSVHCLSN
jgi:hypothetical protein